jgi:hypothetical protein
LALALGSAPTTQPPGWYRAWRLVETDRVHIGLRPAAFVDNETPSGSLEVGAGATLQITASVLSL